MVRIKHRSRDLKLVSRVTEGGHVTEMTIGERSIPAEVRRAEVVPVIWALSKN